jgi:tricorn protease
MRSMYFLFIMAILSFSVFAGSREGYYRYPAIHGDRLVFTSEGDLWSVGINGGAAIRLTTGQGMESHASISPDGLMIAFSGQYEGPTEVYVMPIDGGTPKRLTFDGNNDTVIGWTKGEKIIYSTIIYSTLWNFKLCLLDLKTGMSTQVPLAQASEGEYDVSGDTLYFTRLPFQGSHTKRYKGGTAQNIWRYVMNEKEAIPLTADYKGTSKSPMLWNNRVYFMSDRDGTMNIWSMDKDGKDLKQETFNKGGDAQSASLDDGRIVYQCGADIHLYDVSSGKDHIVPIELSSDYDQELTQWVKKPMDYLTSVHISPDGDRIVLTARGQVFVAPSSQGRFVEVTRNSGVRYRNAIFNPDGKSLIIQSDESGEVEFWKYPANGVGTGEQMTNDGKGFRLQGFPSPDGKMIAYTDKNNKLYIYTLQDKKTIVIDSSEYNQFDNLRWSPDSKWLAYVSSSANINVQIAIYNLFTRRKTFITDDRVNSYDPVWNPDGKWMYFLSDRTFQSLVQSPWGWNQPEPFYDKTTKIYAVSLAKGERFPFTPEDELNAAVEKAKSEDTVKSKSKEKSNEKVDVKIDLDGIQYRVNEVPVPAGNYRDLSMNSKTLFFTETPKEVNAKTKLDAIEIKNKDVSVKPVLEDINSYELSADGKKIVVLKGKSLYVIDASGESIKEISKAEVDLGKWTFSFDPREEWKQMFIEAWRLERDYFYDPGLQGIDYNKLLNMYLPLVDRVRDRDELNDLISQIVGELSALHTFVFGGDIRHESQQISIGSLGALLEKDEKDDGYMIKHIYKSEPDYIDAFSPLMKQGAKVKEGDIILSINGVPTLSVASPNILLENQVGKQVLLHLKSSENGKEYDEIVVPISQQAEFNLRYNEWEYTRRLIVDKQSEDLIGYVHLRAMGGGNYSEWVKSFYPVFNREGLIIDVRHNNGGNIDSWILEKLLRKAWMYWKGRVGAPYWNMQYAFRGHIVVLCDEFTSSDGEAFTEGFKRLNLGTVIGTRTWGGEIWLSLDHWLLDNGIASAGEYGVYGPEGKWLVEGHGVDPGIVVDNTPHETFEGKDAQLEAAINYLEKQIKEHPVVVPPPPKYPDKSVDYNK